MTRDMAYCKGRGYLMLGEGTSAGDRGLAGRPRGLISRHTSAPPYLANILALHLVGRRMPSNLGSASDEHDAVFSQDTVCSALGDEQGVFAAGL
jgi:hypothetical protein